MKDIKSWVLELCILAVVLSLYKLLLPNGNVRRIGEVVFSILILASVLHPVLNTIENHVDIHPMAQYEPVVSQSATYQNAVETVFETALKKHHISFLDVKAEIKKVNENTYDVQKVSITVDDTTMDATLKEMLSKDTNVPAEVIEIKRGTYEEN